MDFPKTFTDDAGRQWTVAITFGTLKRVKALCGLSFDDLIATPKSKGDADAAAKPLRDLMDDSGRFSEVLYAILKPDADAAGLSSSQFDDGFQGAATEAAQAAFLQALYDFFPKAPKKMMVKGLIEDAKGMRILETQARKRIAELETTTNEQMIAMMNQTIDEVLRKSAIATPVSSASTPARSP